MKLAMLGEKIGMTQVFEPSGKAYAVTVIQLGPCQVLQVRTKEKDGYDAVQLGYKDKPERLCNQPETGHAKAHASATPKRHLREIRQDGPVDVKPGALWTVEMFAGVPKVDVVGTMKGRGFAGVMKRHGFSGLETGHGVQRKHRAPGSIGRNTTPGKVVKGTRMNGHYGACRNTIRNLKVVSIDVENNLLLVQGGVPGPNGGLLYVRQTNKIDQKKGRPEDNQKKKGKK
jgi:large subunit ribosomal protein L3